MAATDLHALAQLIRRDRDALLQRWRRLVRELPSARHLDVPTLNDHVPALLIEIAQAFEERSEETIAEAHCEQTPPAHGWQRSHDGFDVTEVVAEYNILRGCVHDLADEHGLEMRGKAFHILNRVLDGAISAAVETFATHRALEMQHRREEHLAFVAHDLRTPLNAISLAVRVLELRPSGSDADSAAMMRSLSRNVRQLESMVEQVLHDSSALQTEVGVKLERRHFDLWPLVEALIHDIRPVAGTASTHLINAIPEDLVVYGDASLLRRVFQNLIANAITYTPHGEVRIGALHRTEDDTIECWVSDNGAGIPAERIEQVFDKGAGDPDRPESTGLGLAIVKTFVEAHGGWVQAESAEGAGSTLRFRLPARPRPATPPGPAA